MDKIKLEYETPDNIIINYNGVKLEIKPFIDFEEQLFLIGNYIDDYFGELEEILIPETKYHYLEAECRLMNYIIQLNTNIDMESAKNSIYADSILWDKITSQISNWWQFRERLNNIVQEILKQREREASLGKVLSELFEKAQSIINQLSEITPEEIQNIQKTGFELIERLEKSSVMKNPNDLATVEQPFIDELKNTLKKE